MIFVTLRIDNLIQLRANFSRAPQLALKYLSQATKKAIFEVENEAVDRNFKFKTPRALRTGRLQLSFAFGRYISPDGLRASIGPTATAGRTGFYYPGKVYMNNKYMDRIATAATPRINGHFQTAIHSFVSDIAKT